MSSATNRNWNKRSPGEVFAGVACVDSTRANEGCCSNTDRSKGRVCFAEAGPIYIHESDCQPEAEILTGYPEEFRELPLLLRAYTQDDGQVDSGLIRQGRRLEGGLY